MSEAVTGATGASTAGATQASGAGQNVGASTQTPGAVTAEANTPSEGARAPKAEATQRETERLLSEQDLDAYIVQKINGKEERIKVRDALKGYGLDKTANQRMQEAAQLRKQTAQLMELAKTDLRQFCEVTGQDFDQVLRQSLAQRKEIAEEILAAEYERSQMSPEQLEALQYKEQLEQYKTREMAQKQPLIDEIKQLLPESLIPKGLENATIEQLQQFAQVKRQEFQQGIDNLSNELLSAWEQSGLPRQKEFGQWMAQVMSDYQKRTGQSLQPADAAARVKARFLDSTRGLLSQMDAKAIQETLGEEIVEKLRKYDVERVSNSSPQLNTNNDQAVPAVNEPKKTMNQFEFRKWAGLTT